MVPSAVYQTSSRCAPASCAMARLMSRAQNGEVSARPASWSGNPRTKLRREMLRGERLGFGGFMLAPSFPRAPGHLIGARFELAHGQLDDGAQARAALDRVREHRNPRRIHA